MKIIKIFLIFSVLTGVFLCSAEAGTSNLSLQIKTAGKKLDHKLNEEITFVCSLVNGVTNSKTEYILLYERNGDDGKKFSGEAVISADKPFVLKTSLDKPGFVRIHAQLADSNGSKLFKKLNGKNVPITFEAGAAADIQNIREALPEPADFDQFWQKQKKRLSAVPMNPVLKEIPCKDGKVKIYEVTLQCAGPRPATGYLTIPSDAKAKTRKAQILFYGYGMAMPSVPASGPVSHIVFTLNTHGYDLGKNSAYYHDFYNKLNYGKYTYAFHPEENKHPENTYFNGMVMRILRALQFLKTLPEWDGINLIATGGSQGGLQAIWAGGLDSDVTAVQAGMPWCCDIGGATAGRIASTMRPAYTGALAYYDAVYHAKRFRRDLITTVLSAGLGDDLCPPSGVAAFFNQCNSAQKSILWIQGATHFTVPKNTDRFSLIQKTDK